MDNGLGHPSLAKAGSSQAEDIAVLVDEAAVEKLLDEAGMERRSLIEIEAIEPFDHTEVRPLEAALEALVLAGCELEAKHR